jgi:hypothetical protein
MVQLKDVLIFAGISQIILVAGSLAVPFLLNWKQELSKVAVLIRQMFWVYSGYIMITNLSFGVLSVLWPEALLEGSVLSRAVTFFIAIYWGARVAIQFIYFDRNSVPQGWVYFWGEWILVILFVLFTIIYSYAFYFNMNYINLR